jgi:ribonuclease VapC
MIVVEGSALLAIFQGEPDAATFATAIFEADRLLISAVNVYETGIVLRVHHGDDAPARLWRFLLEDDDFEIIPFDQRQAHEALTAFGRFGKGPQS